MLANRQACHPTSQESYSHDVLNDSPALRGEEENSGGDGEKQKYRKRNRKDRYNAK